MNLIGGNRGIHVACALVPATDRYNTNPATDVFNTKDYSHITFIVEEGAGGTGTVKIQVEACSAAAGTGNTAIAFNYRLVADTATADTWGALTAIASTGYTTVAGANKMVAVEIDAEELPAGKPFVRLQLTEVVDSPCAASVLAILSGARYPQQVPTTAIA